MNIHMAKKLYVVIVKVMILMLKPVKTSASTAEKMAEQTSSPRLMNLLQKALMMNSIYGYVPAAFWNTGIQVR